METAHASAPGLVLDTDDSMTMPDAPVAGSDSPVYWKSTQQCAFSPITTPRSTTHAAAPNVFNFGSPGFPAPPAGMPSPYVAWSPPPPPFQFSPFPAALPPRESISHDRRRPGRERPRVVQPVMPVTAAPLPYQQQQQPPYSLSPFPPQPMQYGAPLFPPYQPPQGYPLPQHSSAAYSPGNPVVTAPAALPAVVVMQASQLPPVPQHTDSKKESVEPFLSEANLNPGAFEYSSSEEIRREVPLNPGAFEFASSTPASVRPSVFQASVAPVSQSYTSTSAQLNFTCSKCGHSWQSYNLDQHRMQVCHAILDRATGQQCNTRNWSRESRETQNRRIDQNIRVSTGGWLRGTPSQSCTFNPFAQPANVCR